MGEQEKAFASLRGDKYPQIHRAAYDCTNFTIGKLINSEGYLLTLLSLIKPHLLPLPQRSWSGKLSVANASLHLKTYSQMYSSQPTRDPTLDFL